MISTFLVNANQSVIELPEGLDFCELNFRRHRDDLILEAGPTSDSAPGLALYIRGFFDVAEQPSLKSAGGDVVPGAVAAQLAMLSDRVVAAIMVGRMA